MKILYIVITNVLLLNWLIELIIDKKTKNKKYSDDMYLMTFVWSFMPIIHLGQFYFFKEKGIVKQAYEKSNEGIHCSQCKKMFPLYQNKNRRNLAEELVKEKNKEKPTCPNCLSSNTLIINKKLSTKYKLGAIVLLIKAIISTEKQENKIKEMKKEEEKTNKKKIEKIVSKEQKYNKQNDKSFNNNKQMNKNMMRARARR